MEKKHNQRPYKKIEETPGGKKFLGKSWKSIPAFLSAYYITRSSVENCDQYPLDYIYSEYLDWCELWDYKPKNEEDFVILLNLYGFVFGHSDGKKTVFVRKSPAEAPQKLFKTYIIDQK